MIKINEYLMQGKKNSVEGKKELLLRLINSVNGFIENLSDVNCDLDTASFSVNDEFGTDWENSHIINFLNLIWLTSIINVQFLTNEKMRKEFKEGVVNKHFVTIYAQRDKLINKIENGHDSYIQNFLEDLDRKIRDNPQLDVFGFVMSELISKNMKIEIKEIVKNNLIYPDFETFNKSLLIKENKEALQFVESVFICMGHQKYLNRLYEFIENIPMINNSKKDISEDISIASIQNEILNKNNSNSNSLEKSQADIKSFVSGNYREDLKTGAFLEYDSVKLINFIRFLKVKGEHKKAIDVTTDIVKKLNETSLELNILFEKTGDYKTNEEVYELSREITNLTNKKENYQSFINNYFIETVFNNYGHLNVHEINNHKLGSTLENADFLRIYSDFESQSVIKLDFVKLTNYLKKLSSKSDKELSVEEQLFSKFVKLKDIHEFEDDENHSATYKEEIKIGKNYYINKKRGIYFGSVGEDYFLKNKMVLFADFLKKEGLDCNFKISEDNQSCYFVIKHQEIKNENLLNLILKGIVTQEVSLDSKLYEYSLRESFKNLLEYDLYSLIPHTEELSRESPREILKKKFKS